MRPTTLLRIILSIQHLTVSGCHFEESGLVVDVAPTHRVPRCGECGTVARRVHDRRERFWRHLDLAGMTVRLRYSIRRVRCPSCESVKTEQVAWAKAGCNFTHAFDERVAFLAQQCSKTAVKGLMRVAWTTVGGIIRRVVNQAFDTNDDRLDELRHVGIDELSYRRHHKYITTVVNHEAGVVVWAKEGKNAATLRAFFEELGPERCKLIETVTIDMSQAYISAVQAMVPNATIIFDRFHVQRLVQDALDETRRDEVREASTKEEKKRLKNTRWSLLKSSYNLTDSDTQTLDELAESNVSFRQACLTAAPAAPIVAPVPITEQRGTDAVRPTNTPASQLERSRSPIPVVAGESPKGRSHPEGTLAVSDRARRGPWNEPCIHGAGR